MPTKSFEGAPAPWYSSSAIASPGMPEKPSPPPSPPSEVGVAPRLGSAKNIVRPSAPVPPPIEASNSIVMLRGSVAAGQIASPRWKFVAPVSTASLPLSPAEPLNVQPPADGSGISVGAGSERATCTIGATDGTPSALTTNSM